MCVIMGEYSGVVGIKSGVVVASGVGCDAIRVGVMVVVVINIDVSDRERVCSCRQRAYGDMTCDDTVVGRIWFTIGMVVGFRTIRLLSHPVGTIRLVSHTRVGGVHFITRKGSESRGTAAGMTWPPIDKLEVIEPHRREGKT